MRALAAVAAVLAATLASAGTAPHGDVSALVSKHREHRHACKAGHAAKCNTAPRHAQHVKDADSSPNQWNTPVLGPPTTHRDRRHVRVHYPDGSHHYMHIGQARNFTGVTPYGFLEHSSEVMIKNTTILVEDFMPEVKASRFTCEALMAADGSPADEHTQPFHLLDEAGLIRNPVRMTMTVRPGRAEKSGFLDLLRERFVVNNSLVFGGNVFIEHPDFAVGASCGVQIPFDSPFYLIVGASWSGADSNSGAVDNVLDLALLPTTYQDLLLIANVKHAVNPNVEDALAERAAAGLPLGDVSALPAYRARRRLAALSKSGSIAVNWNGKTGAEAAATTASKDIIPGFITCENCYAYMTPTVTLDLKMCAVLGMWGPSKYYYYFWDTDLMGSATSTAPKEYQGGKPSSTNIYSPCSPDSYCVPAASADCTSFKMTTPPFSIASLQTGFSIDAYISGQAGFSYTLIQKPFTGTTSTCSSSSTAFDSTTAETCTKTLFDWLQSPASISLQSTGIPLTMTINGRLRAAMQVTGAYDGAIQFGRTWSVGTTAAPFKLGAKVYVPKMFNEDSTLITPKIAFAKSEADAPAGTTITVIPYSDFPTNNQLQATKIMAPTLLSVKPEAFFYLDTQMSVWGTVPIVGYARARVIASFIAAAGAASTAATSGSASGGKSVALGYASGSSTAVAALTFGASSCPATANGVAQTFGSVSLGVDVTVGLLQQVTLASIKPLKDTLNSFTDPFSTCTGCRDVTGSVNKLLEAGILFNAQINAYTNVLGGATGMNMFSACVSLSASRRLGQAAPRALVNTCPSSGCVYTYDDSSVYSASQAAGGGGGDSSSSSSSGGGGASSALSGGAIAGIVIGVLVGVALIAVGGLFAAGKLPIGDNKGKGGKGPVSSKPGGSSAAKTVGSGENQNPMTNRK